MSFIRDARLWDFQRWSNFNPEEFVCKHCNELYMDEAFLDRYQAIRKACGFPFIVSSAFRCPDHNDEVSSTGRDGPHTTGKAADTKIQGEQAFILISKAQTFGFTGLGINQKGGGRFIHLDDLIKPPRPWIWSY